MRAGVHASTLAGLAQAYLQASDAHAIERLLQAGHHHQAAKRFCDCFSERQFPLEYAYSERGDLIVELTGGIQHEGYADNWEEIGDLWALKPVFLLSWALTEDPYGPLRDEFLHGNLPEDEQESPYRLCDEAREAIAHIAELPAQELFCVLSGIRTAGTAEKEQSVRRESYAGFWVMPNGVVAAMPCEAMSLSMMVGRADHLLAAIVVEPSAARRSLTATISSQWGHGPPGPSLRPKTPHSSQRC
jgi:hypothetical protein